MRATDPAAGGTTVDGVPFFSVARTVARDWPRLEARLVEVVERGEFTAGPVVRELEAAIALRTGARHAVACGSGSEALVIMLRAAGVGPGDEVIVPAYTFFASASSVLHAGADPVFVDVQPGSYAMDPQAAAAAVTPRTRALLPVHLFSQMADMHAIGEVAADHGLAVFEDSAESIGMWMKRRASEKPSATIDTASRHAGLWGQAGVLSFFPTKTLGAFGDAGMLLTDDDELAACARRLRHHGRADASGAHDEIGYNSRLDEIQACVLLTRLERLDEEIDRRAALASRYTAGLADLVPLVRTPWLAPAREPSNQVWYVYLIECERRDALVEHLAAQGVGTEVYYPRPLPAQPCLAGLPGSARPVPVAAAAAARAVALPLYPDLTESQVDRVCAAVRAFYGEPA